MLLVVVASLLPKEALRAKGPSYSPKLRSSKALILWDFEADSGNFDAPPYYTLVSRWEWGVPTAGPSGAHSGTRCWGTNLSGDYEPNSDWRLESQTYDLSGYSSVELAFWHWYDTESGYDTCRLEVSSDGGATWTEVAKWAGSSGGWVQEQVDVSPYISPNFKFRFRLTSDGSVQYEGWYVDDVVLREPTGSTVITATSFEGADDGGFSASGASPAPWERGVPSSGPGSAYDGTNLWATGLSGDYNNSADESLVSSTYDLSAYSNPTLRFWAWYDTETGYDSCFLEVSSDGGLTWSRLAAFAGHDSTWRAYSFPLPAAPQVVFRFRFASDGSVTYPGFYLDSLSVVNLSYNTVASYDFEADSGGFTPDPPSGFVNANEWEWGSPSAGPSGAHSGLRCWGTDLDGNYENNALMDLVSPAVDVSTWPRVTLQFWYYRSSESSDTSFVQVSPDGGTTWYTVDAITSDATTWTLKQYDVTPYASSNFRIRFRFKTDSSLNYSGWYVDDVGLDTVAVPLGQDPICVSQGFVAFYINNSDEPGTFTAATDTLHPWGADVSILYAGASHDPWSSYLTVHCLNNNTDYVTRTSSLTAPSGFSLDTLGKYYLGTWRYKDSQDSVVSVWEVEYAPGDTMRIEQHAYAEGSVLTDARVRLWTLVINKSTSNNLRVGVRYVWDIHINTTDAPALQGFFGPDGWGQVYTWENNWWLSGARYTSDSMAYYYKEQEYPVADPNNHWHYISARWAPWNPQPTAPDTVYYARWPLVASSPGYTWEVPYDTYDSRDSVARNWDDALVALWVPKVVAPGDTFQVNQYVWSSIQPLFFGLDEGSGKPRFELLSPTVLRPGQALLFRSPKLENLEVKLYGLDGRLREVLWKGPVSAGVHRVALPRLSAGVYVLKVEAERERVFKLLVK